MKQRNKPANIATAALFTAVIAVVSQIYIPTPLGIPVTLQTLSVALCGYLLGIKWAAASVLTYILAGAVGLPVFSGFQGGIQHIAGATGGFITGFLILVFFCSALPDKYNRYLKIFMGITGLLLCHTAGVFQFAFVTGTGIPEAIAAVSLPFLLKDIFSVTAASILSVNIKKILLKHK